MLERIVITGVGLTAPNGNSLEEFRESLLSGKSGVGEMEHRYVGKVPAGNCNFDAARYQNKRDIRNGTRAGSIAVYCAHEALKSAGLAVTDENRDRIGVYVGTTEHGNVETENEVYNLSQFDYDVRYWSHHHNPRSISNNPAGEVTMNLKIHGPHYCIGAACAAGNAGMIQGAQQLMLGEVDIAIAGGVSESTHTFGIFASFKSQNALGSNPDPEAVSRPFDQSRNGIVISEGGCLYILERLSDAKKRGAEILAEIVGWGMNSDAEDAVLPSAERQAQCMRAALKMAKLAPNEIDLINTHATSTPLGDIQECKAIREVFGSFEKSPYINNTKGFIGHTMGAAGALELAGNLPSFLDGVIHPCHNLITVDPECALPNLVISAPFRTEPLKTIMNCSFGMLGTNSTLIVKRYDPAL